MIKVNGQEVIFEKFPNGETNLVVESIEKNISTIHPVIHFKYENDSDLIKLMFVKKYIDSFYPLSTRLLIYYMPYSRADRSENGSAFTLKYVSDFINGLNFDKVAVVEPHSNVTSALLDRSESILVSYNMIDDVMNEINFDKELDYVMFPDLGACTRLKDMRYKNTLIGHKDRDFVTGNIKGLDIIGERSTSSKKVLIVDDLSSYGGTFKYSSIELKKMGFEEVYLLVPHAENSIFEKDLFEHINKIFTTDSILTEQQRWYNAKFAPQLKIYDIEGVLSNV